MNGPTARGGAVWKPHAVWMVSKTRKANVRKKLLALKAVRATLAEAAALEAKSTPGALPKPP